MTGLDGAWIRRGAFMGGARGREMTRSFEEVGRDLLRGEREKNVFFSVPRRTNPNKHLLGGLDFLKGLDASNPRGANWS